jgi:hypothetical protein
VAIVVSQYAVLTICALATLGLILRLWIKRRRAGLLTKDIWTTLLGVFALGWIFYRVAWNLVEPAVLRVGMDFDEAQSVLARQRAHPAGFDVILPNAQRDQRNLDFYWLATGPSVRIVSKTTPTGRIVESISVSTYAPKSWESKMDPERDKFLDSFVKVEEYDLKTIPMDGGGVQGDDRVPGGGRERAARIQFISNLIVLGVVALACILGVVAGARITETSIRRIRRRLFAVVVLFALGIILICCLVRLQTWDDILTVIILSTFVLFCYAIYAFFVAVSLIFRAGDRRAGLSLACTALVPVFIILVASVI